MGKAMNRNEIYEETKRDISCVPMSPMISSSSPLDLSKTGRYFMYPQSSTVPLDLSMKTHRINDRQMSIDEIYDPPEILTEPKAEWHYRSMKDLASNHLPLLAGTGPQRTPIRVRVPPISNVDMYLAISILTVNDEYHPSKVIVPAKTTVDPESLSHDNNLDCLRFHDNTSDYFDPESRCIYSKISSSEAAVERKEIRVHMFNLYQSPSITKEMIVTKQLNRCKLSFQLCVQKNGEFIPISQPSYSIEIEEQKMASRPRASQSISKPTVIPVPYSYLYVDYVDPNDTIDNDSC